MILPQTFGAALFLLILGLVCLGSWASAFKLTGRFRYEFFYLDFALGAGLLALIYAFTVGDLGFDGFSFMDDLSHAGKREWLFAFLAGGIFNLGNMLLMASVSVSGLSVAFPAALSVMLILSTTLAAIRGPAGEPTLLVTGCAVLAVAVVVVGIVSNMMGVLRHEEMARSGRAQSTRRPSATKGMVLGILGGLLMGACLPLIDKAKESEIGLGPYTLMVLFAFGMVLSTVVFSVFLMNLPVEGDPAELRDYLRTAPTTHGWGFLAGAMWCTGTLALWVAAHTNELIQDSRSLVFALSKGAPLLATLWGLVVWREFRGADLRVKIMTVLLLVLLGGGLALLALAPAHMPKPT